MPTRIPRNALSFKRRLLRWFRTAGRDLPWRHTRDPYRILVSEFMLQQTQVARVQQFYGPFLVRFPDLRSLAAAAPRRVREAWDGLGYYRRAANLHRLARTIVRERNGRVPADPRDLRRLPGVGPYTAGAVACFAYERRAAAVDTNVARVLSRVFHPRIAVRRQPAAESQRGRPTGRSAAERAIRKLAERILPRRPRIAWEFNQALMDLGATYCRARAPTCRLCPVRPACRTGARAGRTG